MIRAISSFADGPANFNPTSPVEVQAQKFQSRLTKGYCRVDEGKSEFLHAA